MKYTRLVIQRRKTLPEWEDFAHPTEESAQDDFKYFLEQEKSKRYQRPLRLVRETVEIILQSPNNEE